MKQELQTTFRHYLVPSATSEGLGDVATFFLDTIRLPCVAIFIDCQLYSGL